VKDISKLLEARQAWRLKLRTVEARARLLARTAVKEAIRGQGHKLSAFPCSDISTLAYTLLVEDGAPLEKAVNDIYWPKPKQIVRKQVKPR
jgi:hypothetical protein